ncbi:hypothetical protein PT974_09488 [Cladobotryum mycophilum]|uniref:BZIP domain-containing protein n=1 Tax=Cladobotryum mycophilum TaxID=491253 RepID=A0ABR0SGF8_9HYPO
MDPNIATLDMSIAEGAYNVEDNAMAYSTIAGTPIDPQLLPENLASSALAALTHLPTASNMWDASLGNWPPHMGQYALNSEGGVPLDARLRNNGKMDITPKPTGTFQAFQISCPIEPSHPFSRQQNNEDSFSNDTPKNGPQNLNKKKPPAETMTVLSMDIHWAQRRKKKEKPALGDEEQKRERERLKNMNRLAASKSRAKKKKKVNHLEEVKMKLEEKNTLLHTEYQKLLEELERGKGLLAKAGAERGGAQERSDDWNSAKQ